jgi:diketogulonate reductase-like aldo/keto reductase
MAYCATQGIVYQSFSPLCGGFNGSSCTWNGGKNVMTLPDVIQIAGVHNVSSAQIGLKWVVQQGYPLATAIWNLPYMQEDLDLWSWGNLSDAEMKTLSQIQSTPPVADIA